MYGRAGSSSTQSMFKNCDVCLFGEENMKSHCTTSNLHFTFDD
jgi:hypothetical protein